MGVRHSIHYIAKMRTTPRKNARSAARVEKNGGWRTDFNLLWATQRINCIAPPTHTQLSGFAGKKKQRSDGRNILSRESSGIAVEVPEW